MQAVLDLATEYKGLMVKIDEEIDHSRDYPETIDIAILFSDCEKALAVAEAIAKELREHRTHPTVTLLPELLSANQIPLARVLVVLLDQDFATAESWTAKFRCFQSLICQIVPVLLPSYPFPKDATGQPSSKWFPTQLPELEPFLFIDFRIMSDWTRSVEVEEQALHALLQKEGGAKGMEIVSACERLELAQHLAAANLVGKIQAEVVLAVLDALEAEPASALGERRRAFDSVDKMPCSKCMAEWQRDPHIFSRHNLAATLYSWSQTELQRRISMGPSQSYPVASCANKHAFPLTSLLADSQHYQSFPCPSCIDRLKQSPLRNEQNRKIDIHCFPLQLCLDVFGDRGPSDPGLADQPLPLLICPICSVHLKQEVSVSVLDMMPPEVVISRHPGHSLDGLDSPSRRYARALMDLLETQTGARVWIRPEHAAEEGAFEAWKAALQAISSCTIFVALLSDSYCRSSRCRREFEQAVARGRQIVPVLLPHIGMPGEQASGEGSVAWTGPSGLDWWHHALDIARTAKAKIGLYPISWTVLEHFEPLNLTHDLRSVSQRSHNLIDIAKTVSAHLGSEDSKMAVEGRYKIWTGQKMLVFAQEIRVLSFETEAMRLKRSRLHVESVVLFRTLDVTQCGLLTRDGLLRGLALFDIQVSESKIDSVLAKADIEITLGVDPGQFLEVLLLLSTNSTV